jgi:capsular exopolysaccharide synthesis family protein
MPVPAPVLAPLPAPAASGLAVVPPAAPGAGAVVQALRRRWFLALAVTTLSVMAAATAAWFFLKPAATVHSVLLVASTTPKVAFETIDNKGDSRLDYANYQKTQAALVSTRLVLTTALLDPKVAELSVVREHHPEVIEWLEKDLKVDNPPGTELLQITMKGDRPEELKVLVDAITKAYLSEIVDKEHTKREQRLKQLESIYARVEKGLSAGRQELKRLAEAAISGDDKTLSVAQQFSLEQLNMAKKDLMQYRSERLRLEAELKGQATTPAPRLPSPPEHLVDDELRKDPTAIHQLQRIALLVEKVEKIRERSARGETDPMLVAPQRELDALKKSLAARRQTLAEILAKEQVSRADEEAKATVARQRARIKVLKDLETTMTADVSRLTEETQKINKSSLDITAARDAVTRDETVSRKLAEEMEALKVEIEAPARVTKLEDASVSWAGAEKKRMLGLGAGVMAALALSLFGVTWTELRARRFTRVKDVDQLGVRLVGSLPFLEKHPAQRRLTTTEEMPDPVEQKVMTESIDSVRTMLLHLARVESLRVVMLTSALGGEGKTSVACHLAASLARSGRKTLLVDCDLRKPAVHRVFDLPMGLGFSDLLQGTVQLTDVLQATPVEGLSLIPAGLCDAGALRALAQDSARQVFERLRTEFDFIIVDSSPVLPVVDSLLLAQHTDGVLFSLLRDVSRMPTAHAALKKLDALGVRLLGAVVSGTEPEASYDTVY